MNQKTGRFTPAFVLLLGSLLALAFGCHHMDLPWRKECESLNHEFVKYSVFVSPILAEHPPHRVLIIPSGINHRDHEARDLLIQNLASEIRLEGLFEVVTNAGGSCDTPVDAILRGQFDEAEFSRLARQFNVDSIMLVQLNQLDTQWPTSLQASIVMIDVYDSIVSFAVDGNWSTADPAVAKSYALFLKRRRPELEEYLLQPQLRAPSNLNSYAAWQVASALRQTLRP